MADPAPRPTTEPGGATTALGEPATPPGPRAVVATILVAIVLSVLAGLAAPSPWPGGTARLEVEVPGRAPLLVDVELGSEVPVRASDGQVAVDLPDGAPLDGVITVRVAGPAGSAAGLASGLGDVDMRLRLPDDRVEQVPVVRVEDDGALVAQRRPPDGAPVVLGLLAFVAVLWVAGVVPIHLPALAVPIVLAFSGVTTATAALAPFFHPIIVLFFAGFLLARAMQRVGLDDWLATAVVAGASRGPGTLYLATLSLSAFLSMWMSNTASVAVLIPIALAIARPLASPSYERALVLGLAWAATIGGVGSAIGTPANPLAMDFLDRVVGRPVTFAGWFAFGLPMVALVVPVIAGWVWWRSDVEVDPARFRRAAEAATARRRDAGRLDRDQATVLVVFLAVVAVWLTQSWHGLDTGLVALAAAIVLFLLGRLRDEDLGRISWSSLLTFGGGLTLGLQLTEAGVADWVATRLVGLADLPSTLGLLVLAGVVLLLTTLASNTATAAVMVPLAIPLAAILDQDPVVLVVVVAIASSVDFALVIGTPPTMLAHATGLFTTREIFRRGLVLDLVAIVVLVLVVVPVWDLLGVT